MDMTILQFEILMTDENQQLSELHKFPGWPKAGSLCAQLLKVAPGSVC
jgi:hypothetical protein